MLYSAKYFQNINLLPNFKFPTVYAHRTQAHTSVKASFQIKYLFPKEFFVCLIFSSKYFHTNSRPSQRKYEQISFFDALLCSHIFFGTFLFIDHLKMYCIPRVCERYLNDSAVLKQENCVISMNFETKSIFQFRWGQ